MKLLVATRNAHKLVEIRQILDVPGLALVGADEVAGLPDVEETGVTFEENALKKARELCAASGMWTLGDDSGLEVEALGGAPGVYSARYAGGDGGHAANNEKLMAALAGVDDRRARFRCVMALCAPDGREWAVDGRCDGLIVGELRGGGGFGYDPLFVPEGYSETFGQLAAPEKNAISHRGRALRAAEAQWGTMLRALV